MGIVRIGCCKRADTTALLVVSVNPNSDVVDVDLNVDIVFGVYVSCFGNCHCLVSVGNFKEDIVKAGVS